MDAPPLKTCKASNGNKDGSCCTPASEKDIATELTALFAAAKAPVSPRCRELQTEVSCGQCEPWSSHLHEMKLGGDGMTLKQEFCAEYVTECGTALAIPADYCDTYAPEPEPAYSYPFVAPVAGATVVGNKYQPYFPKLALPEYLTGLFLHPDKTKWWLLVQDGVIYEIPNDPATAVMNVVMDIRPFTMFGGEQGLLGLAFLPDFEDSKAFVINYTDLNQNTVIARYTVEATPEETSASAGFLMAFAQPATNHNGGTLLFEPTNNTTAGFYDLYIATGDGGFANDPNNNAQNLSSMLGKIMKIRLIKGETGYTIPDTNPYATSDGVGGNPLPEIWAYGMRNPWKCSFDSANLAVPGEQPVLWAADVGQSAFEEITLVTAGSNNGWPLFEGDGCNVEKNPDCNPLEGANFPIFQYCHTDPPEGTTSLCSDKPFTGKSITGGFVYRGRKYRKSWGGSYFFADFETRILARIARNATTREWEAFVISTEEDDGFFQASSFAEDPNGELLVVKYSEPSGIYAVQCYDCPESEVPDGTPVPTTAVTEPEIEETLAPTMAPTMAPTFAPTFETAAGIAL